MLVPLKPIYGQSPLTTVKSIALRPGQVRMESEKLSTLYTMLCTAGKNHPAAWEPAFRLACLLNAKPCEEPAFGWISAFADTQREDGSFDVPVSDAVHGVCAMMAVYAHRPDRALLEKMMRFCAWLGANWQDVIAAREIRVAAADLMALVCELYRITGKKGLIRLCEQLRQNSMDWASVMHTFSVQRPMKRMVRVSEMEDGMEEEQHHEAGFYTRQYLTCHGETLADGARAALCSSVYSGNGQEATAAKAGWEKISRWHGAVCGGVTSDETLGGLSASCAVDAAALGAWAEAFVQQLQLDDDAQIADALERIVYNGMPAAVQGDKLIPYQRVNGLRMQCGTRDCFTVHEGDEQAMRALCRLARGWNAAAHGAVCSTVKGADVHLYLPGTYALRMDDKTVRMTVSGENGEYRITLNMKQDIDGEIRLRTPVWTDDAFIAVNDEGGHEGKKGTYLALQRKWHDGDVIRISFARKAEVTEGYHQSVSVRYGETVMVCPVTEEAWAYAMTGQPEEREGRVFVTVKSVAQWRCANGVPGDMPVLPAVSGEAVEIEMKPYAQTACRLSALPKAAK